MNVGDRVTVGTGKTVWVILEFWGTGMAQLQRADRKDVHTSCDVERLVLAA